MLDEAHVMAGLDAGHGEERQPLAGAVQGARPRSPRNADLPGLMGGPLPVTVDLTTARRGNKEASKGQRGQNKATSEAIDGYLCVAGLAVLFEPAGRDVWIVVTLQTLPLCHSLTDAALPQSYTGRIEREKLKTNQKYDPNIIFFPSRVLTVVQQVCDVQVERGQDGVEHFEVLPKSGHEQQEAGGRLEE